MERRFMLTEIYVDGDLQYRYVYAQRTKSEAGGIDHFRVPKTLTLKTRPSAKPFL